MSRLPGECQHCGARIEQPKTGRPRRFCGTRCRVAAHRASFVTPISERTFSLEEAIDAKLHVQSRPGSLDRSGLVPQAARAIARDLAVKKQHNLYSLARQGLNPLVSDDSEADEELPPSEEPKPGEWDREVNYVPEPGPFWDGLLPNWRRWPDGIDLATWATSGGALQDLVTEIAAVPAASCEFPESFRVYRPVGEIARWLRSVHDDPKEEAKPLKNYLTIPERVAATERRLDRLERNEQEAHLRRREEAERVLSEYALAEIEITEESRERMERLLA